MLKDSGTQKAQLLAELLDERFPGSQTAWAGPPEHSSYRFEMPGANKRIVVEERVFDIWGGSKPALEKMLQYHDIDKKIAEAPASSEIRIRPGNGEKPEVSVER